MELLAQTNQTAIVAALTSDNGAMTLLDMVRAQIKAEPVADVSTASGRKSIASLAHKVSKTKTAVESSRLELVKADKERLKKIDAEGKAFRDGCDALRDEVRAPLTAWEETDKARIDQHEANIADIQELAMLDSTDALRKAVACLEAKVIGEDWEEFQSRAIVEKDKALSSCRIALIAAEKRDAEAAELQRLRDEAEARTKQEHEARIAAEAVERERKAQAARDAQLAQEQAAREQALKDQAAAAEREKLEAQRREEQAKANAERAAQEAIEREAQAKADAELAKQQAEADAKRREEQAAERERQRQAAEAERERQAQAAREADIENQKQVNRSACAALIEQGLTEDQAKAVINAIRKGFIPRVSIAY
jgi:colicin import membrane protein